MTTLMERYPVFSIRYQMFCDHIRHFKRNYAVQLFITYYFVKYFLAITLLLLLISSWNFHDVCQRFLFNQEQNFVPVILSIYSSSVLYYLKPLQQRNFISVQPLARVNASHLQAGFRHRYARLGHQTSSESPNHHVCQKHGASNSEQFDIHVSL